MSAVDAAMRLDPELSTPEEVKAARVELADLTKRDLIDTLQALAIRVRRAAS